MIRWVRWFIFGVLVLAFSTALAATPGEAFRDLHVQDGGRVKPFDTFARESLQLTYGKSKFNGRQAVDVVLTWMLVPEQWMDRAFIEVRHNGLRKALQLEEMEIIHHSPRELMENSKMALVMQELKEKRSRKEKLDPYFQAVQRLENQLTVFHGIRLGQMLRLVPPKLGDETDAWQSVAKMPDDFQVILGRSAKAYAQTLAAVGDADKLAESKRVLEATIGEFKAAARAYNPEAYGEHSKISAEVHYNSLNPFLWTWILYLVGLVLLAVSRFNWGGLLKASVLFTILGLCLHAYGMGLRIYLTGRAPVSNMFETVVWVPFVAVVLSLVLLFVQRNAMVLLGSLLASIFCLILTDLAPAILDESLTPLEPVLRDNFWLLTHVLIITGSYAAFMLAWALGNVVLFFSLGQEKKRRKSIQELTLLIYRSIQVGVVMLAAGIILGGVWADYSWGRFWGWDPKETWALIALLGYLAILHARLVGWMKPFAMAVSSVIAFSLVIMAWYGVNYVLGAGLHTYGFGAGGVEYVSAAVGIQLLIVAFVAASRHSRLSKTAENSPSVKT
jgi:cytochrome c-type biogenesis protein CcsB